MVSWDFLFHFLLSVAGFGFFPPCLLLLLLLMLLLVGMRRFIFSFETWNVCGGKAYKKQQQQHRRKTLLWRKKNCDWWVRGLRIINIPNRLSVVVCVCIYILYCTHDRTSIHRTSQPEPTLRCGVSKQRNKIQTRINTNMDNLLYNVIRIPSNAYENLAQSVPFWLSGSLSLSHSYFPCF